MSAFLDRVGQSISRRMWAGSRSVAPAEARGSGHEHETESNIERDGSTGTRPRVLDLINTDKSARELLDARVARINRSGRYDNAIACSRGACVDELRTKGHQVFVVDSPRNLSPLPLLTAIGRTVRLLRRERFDLLHTHGSVIGVIGRTAALLARTPVVIHQVHGFHHHEHMAAWKRRLFILVERMMAQCTDRLLFQTEADLLECRRRRIAPARKCVWIGNGIDLSRFRPAKRAPNDPPVVLCVARFEPVKNHEMLFEAVRILYERGMRFRLLLAGEGVEQTRWERWVRDRGFADRVRFLGYRDDVPALTAEADVCVLSSIKEGIPRAVMEAAACGRPMVATDVAGNRDALLDGKTGYLVPLGDAAAMAERIERLLRDEPLRRRMGEAGRRHAEQHFDENRVTERILAVYDEMLASPRIESASERPAKESIAR